MLPLKQKLPKRKPLTRLLPRLLPKKRLLLKKHLPRKVKRLLLKTQKLNFLPTLLIFGKVQASFWSLHFFFASNFPILP